MSSSMSSETVGATLGGSTDETTAADPDTRLRRIRGARTALFVPGDRPERFAKAAAAGAGLVILDLEDAVAAAAKDAAREEVLAALRDSRRTGLRAVVRVDPVGAPHHEAQVEALLELTGDDAGVLGIMLPKAEDPSVLAPLARRCAQAGAGMIALIESAAGVLAAVELAAVEGLTRLAFGAVDYCLDIDADPALEEVLDHPRAVLVLASRAAGLPAPLDTPSTAIRDLAPVQRSARRGRAFGMGGALCIHPAQVPVVETAVAPSEQQIRWARTVLVAEGGAAQVDGAMVDRPVLERARRILATAPATAPSSVDPEEIGPDVVGPRGTDPRKEDS